MKLKLVIACIAVLGSMVLGAGVAGAGTGAARSFSFSPNGGFVDALAAGVDQSNGNVYVSDAGTNSLWEFKVNLTGKSAQPELAFGGEGWVREPLVREPLPGEPPRSELNVPFQPSVDGAHDVLVPTLNGGRVSELSPTGEEIRSARITGLTQPTGVGVDTSGNIYVSQLGGAVRKFNPAGRPVNAIGVETSENALVAAPTGVRGIAVDSTGEQIYLATESGVTKYRLTAGAYVQGTTFGEGFTTGVAVAPPGGPAAGDVFVEASGVITDYEPAGNQLTSFGGEKGHALGAGAGRLAVYGTPTGTVVFAPNRSGVEVYEMFHTPTLITETATEVKRTTATVNATVNPEGLTVTGCSFEYGAGQTHVCNLSGAEIGTGNASVAVSAKLEGLQPGTNYAFHLVVESGGHVISSTGSKLSTPPLATATTQAASSVTVDAATLNAIVNLFVGAGKYHFQYIQEGAAGPHTTEEKPLAVGEQTVTANLTGLQPNKPTFFRVVVVPEAPYKPIDGGFAAFTTKAVPPVASKELATPEPALVTAPGPAPLFTPPASLPPSPIPPAVKPHPRKSGKNETRAQRYAKEVKRCKKIKSKEKRTQCLRSAKKNFGPLVKKKK
jgi:hypothetical protein